MYQHVGLNKQDQLETDRMLHTIAHNYKNNKLETLLYNEDGF